MVACLKAVAAGTKAVLNPVDIVAMSSLNVLVLHAVYSTLLSYRKKNAHLTPTRLLFLQNVLLTTTHVTLCTVLNPSTLLPTAQDQQPHLCLEVVNTVSKPRDALCRFSILCALLVLQTLSTPARRFWISGTNTRYLFRVTFITRITSQTT